MIADISASVRAMRAVASLHVHDKGTSIVNGRIESVGTARLSWFLATNTVHIFISSALCYGGMKFIGFTIGLGELILNCVALEVRSPCRHALSPSVACECPADR